jgi:hypothetical protein
MVMLVTDLPVRATGATSRARQPRATGASTALWAFRNFTAVPRAILAATEAPRRKQGIGKVFEEYSLTITLRVVY